MTIEQEQIRSKLSQAQANRIDVSDLSQTFSSEGTRRDSEVAQANGEENVAHVQFAVGTAANALSTLKLTAVPGAAGSRPSVAIAIDPQKLPKAFKRQGELFDAHLKSVRKSDAERAAAENRLHEKLRQVELTLNFREETARSIKPREPKLPPDKINDPKLA